MKELEELSSKILAEIPSLGYRTNGAIIYKPHFDVFSQKHEDGRFDELRILDGNIYDEYDEIVSDSKIDPSWKCMHPIRLFHVLNYIAYKNCYVKSGYDNNDFHFISNKTKFCYEWYLSSDLLSEQSAETIEFLNTL